MGNRDSSSDSIPHKHNIKTPHVHPTYAVATRSGRSIRPSCGRRRIHFYVLVFVRIERIPGRLTGTLVWFSRPGVAFVCTSSLGIIQELFMNLVRCCCYIRVGEFVGRTVLLSVFSSRNVRVCSNSSGVVSRIMALWTHSIHTQLHLWTCVFSLMTVEWEGRNVS
jgi:hypothetical protein